MGGDIKGAGDPAKSSAPSGAIEDKQLERLYDYTKFHIGIYLGAAAGLLTLISTASAGGSQQSFLTSLIGCRWCLAASLLLLLFAGGAGAVVATSTIACTTYDEFATQPQGALGIKAFKGTTWESIEHRCFWLSLGTFAYGILSAPAVRVWLCS